MINASRRQIARRSPNRPTSPTLADMATFALKNGIQYSAKGRLAGKRRLIAMQQIGPFLVATFAHPTKRITKGRMASLTWRKPEKPVETSV